MILEIAQIIYGLLFFLFLPGYIVTKLWFEDLKGIEKYIVAVIISIMIGIAIGIFFGYDRAQALRTGGFTQGNIWVGELLVTAFLAILLIIKINFIEYHMHRNKHWKSRRKKWTSKKK